MSGAARDLRPTYLDAREGHRGRGDPRAGGHLRRIALHSTGAPVVARTHNTDRRPRKMLHLKSSAHSTMLVTIQGRMYALRLLSAPAASSSDSAACSTECSTSSAGYSSPPAAPPPLAPAGSVASRHTHRSGRRAGARPRSG